MSMRDAGILDGDWLAVHKQAQAENGQVVVARLEDEVTVKRLKLRGARAELLAENPDYSPIVLDLRREPLVIEGNRRRRHPPVALAADTSRRGGASHNLLSKGRHACRHGFSLPFFRTPASSCRPLPPKRRRPAPASRRRSRQRPSAGVRLRVPPG